MDAHTATAKRKRSSTDIRSGDAPAPVSATAAAAAVVEEVSDAEVEEFYAILRRMREASRRLCSGARAAARAPVRAPAWCPSFSWEDFEPPAPASTTPPPPQQQLDERVADNGTPPRRQPCGIDLNVEPEPEPEPPAPATPTSRTRLRLDQKARPAQTHRRYDGDAAARGRPRRTVPTHTLTCGRLP